MISSRATVNGPWRKRSAPGPERRDAARQRRQATSRQASTSSCRVFSPLTVAHSRDRVGVVTGSVKLKLYKGVAMAVEASSPKSLYDTNLASFAMDGYDITAARGFIDLLGLPMQVRGAKQGVGKL